MKKYILLPLFSLVLTAQAEPVGKDVFHCRSNNKRIQVAVSQHGEQYHYTAWSKSRAKPDLFLTNGKLKVDGGIQNVYLFYQPNGWLYEVRESSMEGIKGWVNVEHNGQEVAKIICRK